MTQRIPHPVSPTEVRQAFQQLASQSDVITTGASGYILVGAGVGVTPVWGTSLTSLTKITVDSITIDAATIISATGAISFGNESLTTTGTIAGINVTSGADPGHTHTGASLGTIDISDDTNLAVTAPIVLTDDTLSLNQAGIDHGTIGGLMDDDHTIYLLADGSRELTDDMTVTALKTIDGRDLSVDGTKLDGVEALADVTDVTNVTAAGAAMSGGAFHDGFSDFVGNEHIDWTTDQGATDIHAGNYTDTNTQLTQEEVEDYAGALITDGTGTHTGIAVTYQDGTGDVDMVVDHDAADNFVGNEHIDHTGVSISSGSGLSGGGDISSTRTLVLDINSLSVATIVSGDFIPFWDITATATNKKITFTNFEAALTHANLIGGHNLTTDIDHASITNTHNLTTDIDHDQTTNYDANKHVDHTGVEIATAATSGISGGGTIAATRNLALNINGLTGESAIAGGDTLPFYDTTAGASRKVTLTELSTALGAADEKVKVDVGATAGYLGVAAGDGVLRTNGTIAWTDGGNFVTLALSHLGIESLTNPGADRILFWDNGASATAWLTVGDGNTLSGTTLTGGHTTRCRAYPASDQDIVDSTFTKVILGTEDFDSDGDFATSTFTAPADGYYLVSGAARTSELMGPGKSFVVLLYKDGASFSRAVFVNYDGAGSYFLGGVVTDIMYLAATETAELYVWHNHGANRLIDSDPFTFFTVHRLS